MQGPHAARSFGAQVQRPLLASSCAACRSSQAASVQVTAATSSIAMPTPAALTSFGVRGSRPAVRVEALRAYALAASRAAVRQDVVRHQLSACRRCNKAAAAQPVARAGVAIAPPGSVYASSIQRPQRLGQPYNSKAQKCGLTTRSSGAPAAGRQAAGCRYMVHCLQPAAKPACRWRPLSSNVRPQRGHVFAQP